MPRPVGRLKRSAKAQLCIVPGVQPWVSERVLARLVWVTATGVVLVAKDRASFTYGPSVVGLSGFGLQVSFW